jgi:hypothetical protein
MISLNQLKMIFFIHRLTKLKNNTFLMLFALLYSVNFQAHAEINDNKSNSNIITAVVVKNFPPHYSLNENGKPQGFAIDVLE